MIRRWGPMLVLGTAAALGYAGAHRLGRWLDSPLTELPEHADTDVPEDSTHLAPQATGWRRWTPEDRSDE
jgi:hypothetical protein